MKFRMSKNSLFAVLLRSPWWVSMGIFGAVALVAFAALPPAYAPFVLFGGAPFALISVIVAWRQLRSPSPAQVEHTLQAAGAMPWSEFSAALATAFRHDGHTVTPLPGADADFELVKGWRTTLVSGKRWKAARHGVEPLRELEAARQARDAHFSTYIALGELTENARTFAAENGIRVIQGVELAQWLSVTGAIRKAGTRAGIKSVPRQRP